MYLKQLETANFKFPKKEDVMWYLMTVGGFIIVGSSLFVSFCLTQRPSYICPHSAFLPTIAVPGNEEDYPRMSTGPSFAFKGRPGCGYGGMSLWMTRAILPSSPGWFFCSLHFNVGVSGGCFSRWPPWKMRRKKANWKRSSSTELSWAVPFSSKGS